MAGRIYRRSKGDILQPARFTGGVVRGLKTKAREWSGQYQQEPNPESGNIFDPNWWKYYRLRDPLPEFDLVAISVDCAFKSAAENDLVSIQKWGALGPRCYLLELESRHLGFAATKAHVKAMRNDGRRASVVLIEDKANGSAIIEELRSDPDFGADVIAIEPSGGKEARAHAASATVEAGNVYLPEDAEWLSTFLRTAAAFPAVRHDDDIDALTQFINWRRARDQGELGLITLLKDIGQGIRDAFGRLPKPKAADAAAPAPTPAPLPQASSRPAPELLPFCSQCKNIRLVKIGSMPDRDLHCNMCGADHDRAGNLVAKPSTVIIGVNCCPHPLRQTVATIVRCGNCGQQTTTENGGTNGMTFRQYEARRRSPYGRFSN